MITRLKHFLQRPHSQLVFMAFCWKLFYRLLLYSFILWGIGFIFYHLQVRSFSNDKGEKADAIVVLTGGAGRLQPAVQMLRNKRAKRLLISGVHPSVTRRQIQKLTGAKISLLSCCIDLDYISSSTITNMQETVLWARKHEYHSLILVTADYHMPRSLLLLQSEFTDAEFTEATIIPAAIQTRARADYYIREYHKYLITLLHQTFPL